MRKVKTSTPKKSIIFAKITSVNILDTATKLFFFCDISLVALKLNPKSITKMMYSIILMAVFNTPY